MDALKELDKELKQLISTESGRRSFLSAMPLLLAACATPGKTRYREGDNAGTSHFNFCSRRTRDMTREVLPQMQKDYPTAERTQKCRVTLVTWDKELCEPMTFMVNPYTYNFTVVDVNYVNAFALTCRDCHGNSSS